MFSVVIPLSNKVPFDKRAIDNVFSQSWKDLEVIVVDVGSTDGGGDFVKKAYEDNVILIRQENQGVSIGGDKGI
jgi:glycosyltransferase involved in cell wall biosynthesis